MTGVFSFVRGSPVQIIVYRNHSGPVAWRENTYSQSNKHNPHSLPAADLYLIITNEHSLLGVAHYAN